MFKSSASITMTGVALGGLLLIAGPAAAQGFYGPSIDQREAYQQQRIERGIESGALTPGEARYLEREQGRIEAAEQRMRADGHLSPMERQRLRQMQDRASRDINRLEHNNRTTAGWGGNNYQGWGRHTNTPWQGNHCGAWQGNHYGAWGERGERGYAWQGHHPGGPGNYPGGPGSPQRWQGNGTYGGHGNYPGGGGTAPGTNTPPGNHQNAQGWRGNGTPTGGTTTAGIPQGPQGNNYHNGQPGTFQQPGTRGPGQQQFQQARPQMQQPTIRPNANLMPRQPSNVGRMANRAGSAAPRRR